MLIIYYSLYICLSLSAYAMICTSNLFVFGLLIYWGDLCLSLRDLMWCALSDHDVDGDINVRSEYILSIYYYCCLSPYIVSFFLCWSLSTSPNDSSLISRVRAQYVADRGMLWWSITYVSPKLEVSLTIHLSLQWVPIYTQYIFNISSFLSILRPFHDGVMWNVRCRE